MLAARLEREEEIMYRKRYTRRPRLGALTEDQITELVFGWCLDRAFDDVSDGPHWPWPDAEARETAKRDYAAVIAQCQAADPDGDEVIVLFRELVARGM